MAETHLFNLSVVTVKLKWIRLCKSHMVEISPLVGPSHTVTKPE